MTSKHARNRAKAKKKREPAMRSAAASQPQAEEERWLYEVGALALACSVEVQGLDESLQVLDVFYIRRAGEELWASSKGKPAWRSLDVAGYFRRLAEDLSAEPACDHAFASLASFVTWMERTRRLSHDDAQTLLEALDPYVPALFRDMGYVTPPRAPSNRGRLTAADLH
jgi:hypothetical protein